MRAAAIVTSALVCLPTMLLAQSQVEDPAFHIGAGDVVSVVGAGLLLAVPELTGINRDSVRCVPCDRSAVPFFDRWVIAPTRPAAATGSDLLRAGVAVGSWLDLANEGPAGHSAIAASLQSVLWAESLVHLVKAGVGRYRPVLYTEDGRAVAHLVSNQRSWPSGHAATAAALATSYWLSRRKLSPDGETDWRPWLVAAGALGVGILRMAAAKHYPSDVLSGFAVGAATALVVHELKF